MSTSDEERDPVVSKRAEAGLLERMKVAARKQCHDTIAAYAECTKDKTISVIWACRPALNDMNRCLQQYTTDEVLSQYKREYLASRHKELAEE